ncbi:MAG: DUF2075 domain-containing protein [Oligoflexus sp.]|nr:DUF2075 domain-containing protein [Oligoflexus sp.]
MKVDYTIEQYNFNQTLFADLDNHHYAKQQWPLIYILTNDVTRRAYVGETADTMSRMGAHLAHKDKSSLTKVFIISSAFFNKSATLDIESYLIKFISGDGTYKLLNGNIGLANHNYYQKQAYWETFNTMWDDLRSRGVASKSLNTIGNSDLFKYSPYKTLTQEQRLIFLEILNCLLDDNIKCIMIEGGAGTGKTVIASFLFKVANSPTTEMNFNDFGREEESFIETVKLFKAKYEKPQMGLVIPMSSFRSTLKKVFKGIQGLSPNMVMGPAEVANSNFDILVVDESHRLRQRVNLGAYFGNFDKVCEKLGFDKNSASELDWVIKQSQKAILFYDRNQSIKPSDISNEVFDSIRKKDNSKIINLKGQIRSKGGDYYSDFLTSILYSDRPSLSKFQSPNFDLFLFDSLEEMFDLIKKRNVEFSLSRMTAGYAWPWQSKDDKSLFDIEIDGSKFRWNSTNDDWINSDNSIDEIGCIHTTQGYDLNYVGVIFGREIGYDTILKKITINEALYFDRNGKHSKVSGTDLANYIINIYKTLLMRGIKGAYIYVCDNDLRKYLSQFIFNINPKNEIIQNTQIELRPFENCVPLYDLRAAAGQFGEVQAVNYVNWVVLPEGTKPAKDWFACRVFGESMNKVIQDGQLCLFSADRGGSREGKIVLVESRETSEVSDSKYTVKEYHSRKFENDDHVAQSEIILTPLSFDPTHKEIRLTETDNIAFRVVGIFLRTFA